jgi:hypothetical protein
MFGSGLLISFGSQSDEGLKNEAILSIDPELAVQLDFKMAAVVAVCVHYKPQLCTTAVVCLAYRWAQRCGQCSVGQQLTTLTTLIQHQC